MMTRLIHSVRRHRILQVLMLSMWILSVATAHAARYHVVVSGGSDASDGLGWATALATIPEAMSRAGDGDTVMLSNGTFNITAQIDLTNAVTFTSTNGWQYTMVDAGAASRVFSMTNANGVINGLTIANGKPGGYEGGGCVWMSGGILTNCVVRDGYTYRGGGGGVYMSGGIVTHCTIANSDLISDQSGRYAQGGGGVYISGGILESSLIASNTCNGAGDPFGSKEYCAGGGVRAIAGLVRNCLIRDNAATEAYGYGAGVGVSGSGIILNCTITENNAQASAGGVSSVKVTGGYVTNCIVYDNACAAPGQPDDIDELVIATYSCSLDLTNGAGNITSDPLFVDQANKNFRLSLSSPCRNAGMNVSAAGGVDLDGGDRIYTGDGASRIDMGAYEIGAGIGSLQCDFEAVPAVGAAPMEVVLTATVLGPNTNGLYYWWDFDNSGSVDAEGSDKKVVTNTYPADVYSVKLTVSNAVGAVTNKVRTNYVMSVASTVYVATNGSGTAPYDTWGKAATNLLDALALQQDGGTVLVSNGTYAMTGEWPMERGVVVRGVNGSSNTVLQRVGASYFRLFSLTHTDAVLDGLTLENGRRPSYGFGANVWMNAGLLMNCVVRNGEIYRYGGAGVYMNGGLVTHCVITNNVGTADQDGRYSIGGGGVLIDGGILQNSLIAYNQNNGAGDAAPLAGGGVRSRGGLVRNCLIRGNSATASRGYGGGVGVSGSGIILNCTIVQNDADASAGGVSSVKVAGGYVTNCVVYDNTCAAAGKPVDVDEPGIATYSCSVDLTNGAGNITSDPLFVDQANGDFRLSLSSPCRNAGTNVSAAGGVDLDNGNRIYTGDGVSRIDMGAYEIGSGISSLQCDLEAVPAVGSAPLDVVLTATVLGPNTNGLYYWWDFENNGSDDTEGGGKRVVTNTYPSGVYSVKLTVSNAVGAVTNKIRVDYIMAIPTTVYVATNGSDTVPYDTWGKAATNLGDAVALQQDGGIVLVSNGIHIVDAEITVSKGIVIRGFGGPDNTLIQRTSGSFRILSLVHPNACVDGLTIANGAPASDTLGGCVWMSGGMLTNCVVKDGYTYRGGGSGIYMSGGVVTRCIVTNNVGGADQDGRYAEGGGGVYIAGGVLESSRIVGNSCNGANDTLPLAGGGVRSIGGLVRNCLIRENSATGIRGYGGGVGVSGSGRIINCTIVDNTAGASAGGLSSIKVSGGYATNCIIYNNNCTLEGNPNDVDEPAAIAYSCSLGLAAGTNGNIIADPDFIDRPSGNYRLQLASPARNTGTNVADVGAVDLDNAQRVFESIPDMGAYEIAGTALDCDFGANPQAGQVPLQVVFTATFLGNTNGLYYWWDFEDDASVDANGLGLRVVTNTYAAGGLYSVTLTVSNTIAEVANQLRVDYITCVPEIVYVATNGTGTIPYDTPAKASTNLAEAVSFQQAGGSVLISDGTFMIGSQLVIDKGITIYSVNGPTQTTIQRQSGTMRIFSVSHADAIISGVTIADGDGEDGAGIFLSDGVISNCIIRDGVSQYEGHGGGIKMTGGLVTHCVITNNQVNGGQGGRYTEGGGGVYMTGGILQNSVIVDNWTVGAGDPNYCAGGGVRCLGGVVRNCLIRWNSTTDALRGYGGGVGVSGSGRIINCTIVDNMAGASAGGVSSIKLAGGYVTNCIIYHNICTGSPDDIDEPAAAAYSCSPDLTDGVDGNITADPMFVDTNAADYHVESSSPCIDKGIELSWMIGAHDLDENARVLNGNVDIGCYESNARMGTVITIR